MRRIRNRWIQPAINLLIVVVLLTALSYLPPDTPYSNVRNRFVSLSSAPDSTSGVVSVVNRDRKTALSSWMDTGGTANYLSYLSGDGERVTVLHYDLRVDRMHRRSAVASVLS